MAVVRATVWRIRAVRGGWGRHINTPKGVASLLSHKPSERPRRRYRGIVAVLVLGAACVALSSPGPAGAYTPVPCGPDLKHGSVCPFPAHPDKGYPPGQPAYTYNDCLWGYILNPNNVLTNQTGVDANNGYFTANFSMPPHSNIMGGVAPPTHTIVLANGKTYTGKAMCKVVRSAAGSLNGPSFFKAGVPNSLYAFLHQLGPVGHPATRVPEWQRYYNQTQILKPLFQHTRLAFLI